MTSSANVQSGDAVLMTSSSDVQSKECFLSRDISWFPRPTVSSLNPHITCSLCNGYLIDATAIKACIHSFCRSCIVKHLQTNDHCPLCHVTVIIPGTIPRPPTTQLLRSDRILQTIVYKLVAGLYKNEQQRRIAVLRANGELSTPSQDIVPNSHLPSQTSSCQRKRRRPTRHRPIIDADGVISVGLRASGLEARYLLCPAAMTVGSVKQLIMSKFSLAKQDYEVDVSLPNATLADDQKLLDAAYISKWQQDEPLILNYVIVDKCATAAAPGECYEIVTSDDVRPTPVTAAAASAPTAASITAMSPRTHHGSATPPSRSRQGSAAGTDTSRTNPQREIQSTESVTSSPGTRATLRDSVTAAPSSCNLTGTVSPEKRHITSVCNLEKPATVPADSSPTHSLSKTRVAQDVLSPQNIVLQISGTFPVQALSIGAAENNPTTADTRDTRCSSQESVPSNGIPAVNTLQFVQSICNGSSRRKRISSSCTPVKNGSDSASCSSSPLEIIFPNSPHPNSSSLSYNSNLCINYAEGSLSVIPCLRCTHCTTSEDLKRKMQTTGWDKTYEDGLSGSDVSHSDICGEELSPSGANTDASNDGIAVTNCLQQQPEAEHIKRQQPMHQQVVHRQADRTLLVTRDSVQLSSRQAKRRQRSLEAIVSSLKPQTLSVGQPQKNVAEPLQGGTKKTVAGHETARGIKFTHGGAPVMRSGSGAKTVDTGLSNGKSNANVNSSNRLNNGVTSSPKPTCNAENVTNSCKSENVTKSALRTTNGTDVQKNGVTRLTSNGLPSSSGVTGDAAWNGQASFMALTGPAYQTAEHSRMPIGIVNCTNNSASPQRGKRIPDCEITSCCNQVLGLSSDNVHAVLRDGISPGNSYDNVCVGGATQVTGFIANNSNGLGRKRPITNENDTKVSCESCSCGGPRIGDGHVGVGGGIAGIKASAVVPPIKRLKQMTVPYTANAQSTNMFPSAGPCKEGHLAGSKGNGILMPTGVHQPQPTVQSGMCSTAGMLGAAPWGNYGVANAWNSTGISSQQLLAMQQHHQNQLQQKQQRQQQLNKKQSKNNNGSNKIMNNQQQLWIGNAKSSSVYQQKTQWQQQQQQQLQQQQKQQALHLQQQQQKLSQQQQMHLQQQKQQIQQQQKQKQLVDNQQFHHQLMQQQQMQFHHAQLQQQQQMQQQLQLMQIQNTRQRAPSPAMPSSSTNQRLASTSSSSSWDGSSAGSDGGVVGGGGGVGAYDVTMISSPPEPECEEEQVEGDEEGDGEDQQLGEVCGLPENCDSVGQGCGPLGPVCSPSGPSCGPEVLGQGCGSVREDAPIELTTKESRDRKLTEERTQMTSNYSRTYATLAALLQRR